MIRETMIAALFATGPALADPPSKLPERMCVPTHVLDQIANYAAGQPWKDVAEIMATLTQVVKKAEPCPAPKDDEHPPKEQP